MAITVILNNAKDLSPRMNVKREPLFFTLLGPFRSKVNRNLFSAAKSFAEFPESKENTSVHERLAGAVGAPFEGEQEGESRPFRGRKG